MAATSFFFDYMTVVFKQASNTLTVGVLQEVTITGNFEHIELYGAGSIKREDVARRKHSVDVSCKVAKFHPNILGYIMGTRNADKDIDGGIATGKTQGLVTDSNTVILFQLTGTLTGKNSEAFKARADNVYFENMTFGGSQGEYVALDLKGKGDNFIVEYTTT